MLDKYSLLNMATWLKHGVIGISILCLAISYIFLEMIHINMISHIVGIYVVLFILFSITRSKGKVAKITYSLLMMTIILLFQVENPLYAILEGSLVNLPIVCILIVTPLLGISVRVGNYVDSLKSLLRKYNNNVSFFYIVFLVLSHIFSVFLNIGSIIINLTLMKSSNVKSKKLIANILNRGYTTTATWSPYLGVVALVISQLKISWSALVFYTLGFVFISMVIAYLVDMRTIKAEKIRLATSEEALEMNASKGIQRGVARKLIELSLLLIISMSAILLIDTFTNLKIVLAITFVSISLPFIWCLIKKQMNSYKREVSEHINTTLPRLQTEFTMFLMAGIFSNVFVNSPFSEKAVNLLIYLFGNSILLMTLVLSFLIIISGVLGLHPVVMLTIFVTGVNPEILGFSPLYFAALLLGSAGIANNISPATAVNNLLSNALHIDLFTVSFRWNWLYTLILFFILPVYLLFIGI